MIVGDIDLSRGRLSYRADAEEHAVALPALLVDAEHGHADCGARQTTLKAPRGFFTAKPVRNRDDEWRGHRKIPCVPIACSRNAREWKRSVFMALQKWNFAGSRRFPRLTRRQTP